MWAFLRWQRRQARRDAPQLLPPALLAQPSFRFGAGLAAVLFSGIPGFFLVLAIYLQTGYGLTPLQSGLTTMPFSLGVLCASPVSARLGDRHLRLRIAAGAGLLAVGLGVLRVVILSMGDTIQWLHLAPALAIGGFGLGLAVSPLFQTALSGAGRTSSGGASGAVQAVQQVGGSLGVAIMGGLFFASVGHGGEAADKTVYAHAVTRAMLYSTGAFAFIAVTALVSRFRGRTPELTPAPPG